MENIAEISQHLLRFSPDAIIVVNDRREICFANDTVSQLFGYAPADLIGRPLDTLLPERLRARHGSHVAGFMSNPSNREMGVRITDLTARRADGSEFPAGIRLSPFQVKERTYVAAAIRDVTESHEISAELVVAREEADRANRAKSRFLATASHDLRQPLQAIRLLNASMLKLMQDHAVHELLKQQEQAIDGMARLLNGLLDISRLESGTMEVQQSVIALTGLLSELRSEFATVAQSRGLSLTIRTVDVSLRTDRVLLRQLLENVVGNAIKYTDHGQVTLVASASADGLLIEIADTGVGIPDDKIARIFDEYYQVDVHGARRAGVGLGLAIVREVARLLGVSIKVMSQVGHGTQVQIRIPQEMISDELQSEIAHTENPTAVLEAAEARPRLVLIEDNDGVRRAMELFLRLEGFDVSSGMAAADIDQLLAQPQGNELLIVDYHLDGTNTGLDVVRRVRGRSAVEVPAVVMSGDLPSVLRTIKEPIARCRFLSKPVDTSELLVAIKELARGHADS